jgi:hypothetical protein
MPVMSDQPVNLFFSYSQADKVLRDELAKHLSVLKRQGVIRDWHDRDINAGDQWQTEGDRELSKARIILLLVSPDFLDSDYSYDIEMKRAMERHEAGEARVIPVILRPCDWRHAPFGKLQSLPRDGKPVTKWENRDEAFTDIAREIRKIVERFPAKPEERIETPTPPSLWNIPARDPYFVNRTALLAELHRALALASGAPEAQSLIGQAGIGKSAVAAEYFHRYANQYQVAWWVKASDQDAIVQDYLELAQVLGFPAPNEINQRDLVRGVRRWFEAHTNWLLVFDDVRQMDDLGEFYPRSQTGHVLITSRQSDWAGFGRRLDVSALSREDAVEFLLRRTQQTDVGAAEALAEALGDVPLALALAGANVEETGATLAGYLELFRRSTTQALSELGEQKIQTAQQFLERAGAVVRRRGEQGLELVSAPLEKLATYVPLPVFFSGEAAEDEDVVELARSLRTSTARPGSQEGQERRRAGILLYRQQPDALALIRMAEAQLRSRFVTIPIPLAAIENALSSNADCRGLLAEYAERYLPGANLFNDRNAISDTTTFFGRAELLNRLEQDLINRQGIGLFGLRKSGKTSVLLQLKLMLRRHPVVHIDLQIHGGKPRYGAELFNEILKRLGEMLLARNGEIPAGVEQFSSTAAAAEIASRFKDSVSRIAEKLQEAGYAPPIVCLLDEVERILPRPEDSREKAEEFNAFFGVLRVLCQQKRQLSLLVTDVHPDCNRINHWAQPGVPTNPVYKFFKDEFLQPFSAEETKTMLTSIGQLMGYQKLFDEESLAEIHRISGGHPFIARQLAYLLYLKIRPGDGETIHQSSARPVLNRALRDSSTLRDYVEAGIWDDLMKRRFEPAMAVLKMLAGRREQWIPETVLHKPIAHQVSQSPFWDALQWLVDVGLVDREEAADEDRYRIRLALLAEWLRMNLSQDEVRQWQQAA